jgi:hypothetical protein
MQQEKQQHEKLQRFLKIRYTAVETARSLAGLPPQRKGSALRSLKVT